ncbi:dynamin family protein [Cereibacter sphaeroides]|uniref:dynamin family protein n=1 Tax=Cereibacter sphaeroides TaxID=1063 RepID=UPI003990866F
MARLRRWSVRDFAEKTEPVSPLGRPAFEELESYRTSLGRIREALLELASDATPTLRTDLDRIVERIDAFEPSVSLLGQVKAGKSTLLNALIGRPGFLPADVNPWTSVITNVHLNSPRRPLKTRALFRFFDALEWERLALTGGRLGEMARRAGFTDEAEEVRAQVMRMRRATEARLGSGFETLLGSSHAFPDLRSDIIDRYICYGDPADASAGGQGFYADLTRTADLYLDLPGYPQNLCLRDTPGVNDTVLMREQVTLNAISESPVCVIVLSAHQALTTMDMALLRIIGNVEAREVLLFVNRIDELADPAPQCREIEAAMRRTLARAEVGAGLTILFGSALWAVRALEDRCEALPAASCAALRLWAAEQGLREEGNLCRMAFEASGVPKLRAAIARRVVEGPGQAMLANIRAETGNVISEVETVDVVARSQPARRVDRAGIEARAAEVARLCETRLAARLAEAAAALSDRLGRAQEQFVEGAVAALAAHIAAGGDGEGWRCDPTALRMMIRSAYLAAAKAGRDALADCTAEAAEGYGRILCGDLAVPEGSVAFHLPQGPVPQAPGPIAQAIALDMQTAWWRRFFQRRAAPQELASRYRALIADETRPMIEAVAKEEFTLFCDALSEAARAFCTRQAGFVTAVLDAMERPATDEKAQRGAA